MDKLSLKPVTIPLFLKELKRGTSKSAVALAMVGATAVDSSVSGADADGDGIVASTETGADGLVDGGADRDGSASAAAATSFSGSGNESAAPSASGGVLPDTGGVPLVVPAVGAPLLSWRRVCCVVSCAGRR